MDYGGIARVRIRSSADGIGANGKWCRHKKKDLSAEQIVAMVLLMMWAWATGKEMCGGSTGWVSGCKSN